MPLVLTLCLTQNSQPCVKPVNSLGVCRFAVSLCQSSSPDPWSCTHQPRIRQEDRHEREVIISSNRVGRARKREPVELVLLFRTWTCSCLSACQATLWSRQISTILASRRRRRE
ncbi:hypothetical protein ASPVEDRAFT_39132 [Aspergillus versicolor CBS 583.65]|uniref:Uncharacterized protein n=1 Tax=Aspergillus versicolor CBS 583.65 TaxID=1036611 RepID=A0A1L9PE49_ASPVE|nr:uncharacterized protein ASPVEDRAFT_39132 [Aspergillus versicolor CBS 583.65]OJI99758.1 hypothetical protein ASPVEDRAFT_39132 [Aspergillus versicolor CBS 583.65]